jgi:hypothetical protein
MFEDISLISLAAWLYRQSEMAQAAAQSDAEEYGARATLETAARLAQASRVVKEVADRKRLERDDISQPSAANKA